MIDAIELRSEIQSFVVESGISIARFAKDAGVPAPTLQHMMAPDWKPSFAIMQACIVAVRRARPRQDNQFKPIEFLLPPSLIERPANKNFALCLQAWREKSGTFSSSLLNAIEKTGLGDRLSLVEAGDDNRLWLKKFGPTAFGRDVNNCRLADLPDKDFGSWMEQRIWPMMSTGEPVFASCEIRLNTIFGDYSIPYTTLRLPLRDDGEVSFYNQAITITRLEESPDKSRMELGDPSSF